MFKELGTKTLEYVVTPNGRLRGFRERNTYSFLGVVYGRCKRWQRATPAAPWRGTVNAVQFGNRAFPGGMLFTPWDSCGVPHETYSYSEDCLNLNIWTPSIDAQACKPVLVWIHGGGFSTGSAMEMQAHHGENLSEFGDVVVVTVNHRLNIFGFCDMSRFGKEYENSGSNGLSDLVLALQWVQDNIRCFGGDPNNVLIFGQSGGGMKVTDLMQIREARGLFHKVVCMSGSVPERFSADQGKRFSDTVVELLLKKYDTDSIETLLELEPEELLESVESFGITEQYGLGWQPVIDSFFPGHPSTVGFSEYAKDIPMIIGCTIAESPEVRIFDKQKYTEEEKMAIIRECFPGQDVESAVRLFSKAWPGKSITDLIEMTGTLNFRPSDIRMQDQRARECTAPTYAYVFAHEYPQEGGRLAWHCADIPVVFHNSCEYPSNFKEGLLDGLEDEICGSLISFAYTGSPNGDHLKGCVWCRYDVQDMATMIFDNDLELRTGGFDRELVQMRDKMQLQKPRQFASPGLVIN